MDYKTAKDLVDGTQEVVKKCSDLALEYIKNTVQPLDERWKFFVESPKYLFRHKGFIYHITPFEAKGCEIGYDMDIHAERYAIIDVGETIHEFFLDQPEKFTEEEVIAIKEFILKDGFRTFRYDW
jgi:hypothetical protein